MSNVHFHDVNLAKSCISDTIRFAGLRCFIKRTFFTPVNRIKSFTKNKMAAAKHKVKTRQVIATK